MPKILITGTAGFIGFHIAQKLLELGNEVLGLDNINGYYDTRLKYARLNETGIAERDIDYAKIINSSSYSNYRFIKLDLADYDSIIKLFAIEKFDYVIHMAAMAGVRYSLKNPQAYVKSNLNGYFNMLEACRQSGIRHLIYASSSSVYGTNEKQPFSTSDRVDKPMSLYAATKKSNELMAHSYSHLYGLSTIGLRFFTVYGPWGRPDMAPFIFTKSILEGSSIDVYNHGNMQRDFIYINDIVDGIVKISEQLHLSTKKENDKISIDSQSAYRVYNIGSGKPLSLTGFIRVIEDTLNKKAKVNLCPMQSGDLHETFADINDLIKDFNYKPKTSIESGMNEFTKWFKSFYRY